MSREGELGRVRSEWDRVAIADPLWAVVSRADKRGGNWDAGEFFATGEERVREVYSQVEGCGLDVPLGCALDFGCGVGRLTQALAPRFSKVVGVDIAENMVGAARDYNQWPDRVEYRLNSSPDLHQFGDKTFDFVLADIVLQHLPRRLSLAYLAEFIRVLRPSGVAAFQLPSGPVSPWLRWLPARLTVYGYNQSRALRRWLNPSRHERWESHWVPRNVVATAVGRAGGIVQGIVDQDPIEGKLKNQTYVVRTRSQ